MWEKSKFFSTPSTQSPIRYPSRLFLCEWFALTQSSVLVAFWQAVSKYSQKYNSRQRQYLNFPSVSEGVSLRVKSFTVIYFTVCICDSNMSSPMSLVFMKGNIWLIELNLNLVKKCTMIFITLNVSRRCRWWSFSISLIQMLHLQMIGARENCRKEVRGMAIILAA